jgi:hypothetical protein
MLLIKPQYVEAVRRASSAEDLHAMVQSAIELEHSTIPPYLCAYFSLKPATNQMAADIIRSVVLQEMLHMTIASNLLIALGGRPRINEPGFIPAFPGPLPMNVGDGLRVRLRKCSKEQVEDIFMQIEEPEDPLEFPTRSLLEARTGLEQSFATIGQFYTALAEKIMELGSGAFTGDPDWEVIADGWFSKEENFKISDPETACMALSIIVKQGEGTPEAPVDPDGEIAHYYRFSEIVKGRKLVKDDGVEQGWSFSGEPVVLDTNGIWNMEDDPKAANYPQGTRARRLADKFNHSYTKLLNALNAAFNGAPEQMDAAIGLMYELRLLAQDVLATPTPAGGAQTGLPFEYNPMSA